MRHRCSGSRCGVACDLCWCGGSSWWTLLCCGSATRRNVLFSFLLAPLQAGWPLVPKVAGEQCAVLPVVNPEQRQTRPTQHGAQHMTILAKHRRAHASQPSHHAASPNHVQPSHARHPQPWDPPPLQPPQRAPLATARQPVASLEPGVKEVAVGHVGDEEARRQAAQQPQPGAGAGAHAAVAPRRPLLLHRHLRRARAGGAVAAAVRRRRVAVPCARPQVGCAARSTRRAQGRVSPSGSAIGASARRACSKP